jgi:hypothetical protein
VPDDDGFILKVGGLDPVEIESGETIVFSQLNLSNVTEFSLLGIDPALGLQPDDPLAFVTGLAFFNQAETTLTQTPITANPIPLPASAWMLLSAAGGLVLLRRFGRIG